MSCTRNACSSLAVIWLFPAGLLCTNALAHPLTSAGSRYVLDSASTGMTPVRPAGKSNFHTDRRRASQHLCSCLSKQELRQTDKNSDKMCQFPQEKVWENKAWEELGEKLRPGRIDDNICLCLPTTVVYWRAGCGLAMIALNLCSPSRHTGEEGGVHEQHLSPILLPWWPQWFNSTHVLTAQKVPLQLHFSNKEKGPAQRRICVLVGNKVFLCSQNRPERAWNKCVYKKNCRTVDLKSWFRCFAAGGMGQICW